MGLAGVGRVGYACFYGADNEAAAGCDEEESTRVSQREPGGQVSDLGRVGGVDGLASRLRPGCVAGCFAIEDRDTQAWAGTNVWACSHEGSGEVLGGVAGPGREATRADVAGSGAIAASRQ